MADRIGSYVHVAGFLLVPGDVPPPDLADQVSNPKAWASTDQAAERLAPRRVGQSPDPSEDSDEDQEQEEGGDQDEEDSGQGPDVEGEDPPRPGKNAKVDTWRTYILAVADVTEDDLAELTKDQLIEMADQLDAEDAEQ